MFFLLPFFIILTLKGSQIFVNIDIDNMDSAGISATYPFLIFWFILSYVLIFSYIGLICHGYDQASKAAQVRKNIVQLLRRLNSNGMDQEIYENALANIQEELQRR